MAELKFLDDLAKFGNNTMTAMSSFQRQASKWVADQTHTLIKGMDLVTKEEAEGYKQSISELETRLKLLEEKLAKPAKAETAKPESTKAKTKKAE